MRIGILEPLEFSIKALQSLKLMGDVSLFDGKNLKEFISNKEIIFTRLNYFLGEKQLQKAYSLKYICSPTTGFNHLDINYINKKNIKIISLKGENNFLSDIRATSEHTLGLILSLLRNYRNSFISDQNKFNRDLYKGYEIYNNKIGIIGFGRIGKLLSKYIESFNGQCYFYDKDDDVMSSNRAQKVNSIEELIDRCNIICLCASYDNENHQFFNIDYIDKMKGKFLINTSRGELVDEKHLIRRINEGFFKGVAIDVISNESKKSNNLKKFLNINKDINFIITPHIGGATYTSMKRTEEFIVNKLKKAIL